MEVCEACVVAAVVRDCWLATSMMKMIQPPTERLPPIARIATFTTTQLFESVQYLQSLYRPQVRGSRRRRQDDDHKVVRSDAFERAYAIRWLTALIAQLEARTSSDPPTDDTDTLIQQVASLLATCAGVAAAGKVQHRFTFESALARKIHVDLTDIPLDNHDYESVGAQTWGGACVLAEMIAELFSLGTPRPRARHRYWAGRVDGRKTIARVAPLQSKSDPPSSSVHCPHRLLSCRTGQPAVQYSCQLSRPSRRHQLPFDPHQQSSFGLVVVLNDRDDTGYLVDPI